MKKIFAFLIILFFVGKAIGQPMNNEWIDFNKTYYKFKVGATGLYRITVADLNTINIGNEAAQNFQLWRNGKQVPIYTSAASGSLGANGYIEFWGERNDGVPDKNLYRFPEHQLNDKRSLLTDTAAYFLTVNPDLTNTRLVTTPNNVAGNVLPAMPWFIDVARNDFVDRIHRGRALVAGSEYIYSSAYDQGEMWSSLDINPATPVNLSFSNLFVAPAGPAAIVRAAIAGSAPNSRQFRIDVNSTTVIDSSFSQFAAFVIAKSNVANTLLASNTANIAIRNLSGNSFDRIVCNYVELNYARQFNFGNRSSFEFSIPDIGVSKYLEITNFNTGGVAPILYDLTNNRRYVADITNPAMVKIVLQPSTTATRYVLVSQAASNYKTVSNFQTRNFVNYTQAANQGDYMIITHAKLQQPFNGANQVELYRAYRASVAGGSFNAKVYDIDQLVDQFGLGIKKNPLCVKNFLRYARSIFPVQPKFAFIIGRGLAYDEYRINEASPYADALNLVPTFGYPASDVLLASNNHDPVMNTYLGRFSAISPFEIADYLDKMKQYETQQKNTVQTISNKSWMKNFVHVVGGNDPFLEQRLSQYMSNYRLIITDTLVGATVVNFSKSSSGAVTTITNSLMRETFEKGISFLNFFGHSSATSLDYNLDDPYTYNNPGKYPVFCVNGCNAGNLYSFDTTRFTTLATLSERWVLAKNRGAIGFIASTHFGLENYLDFYIRGMYKSMATTGYRKSIGQNINEAIVNLLGLVGINDYAGRLHAEQTTLHGDPALMVNAEALPDFVVEESQIKINPNIVSVADPKFDVKVYLYNLGKAVGDSVRVSVRHQYPDGTSAFLFNKRIRSVRFIDSVSLQVPIQPIRDRGQNKIIVSIDTDNAYAELSENNNTNEKTFLILDDDLRPVFPYNYSIVNRANAKLYASTANPLSPIKQYTMEMDTTELFNSSFKITKNISSVGGSIEFDPGITYTDSTVYYWRVTTAPATGQQPRWNNSSFVYLAGTNTGYNQSHFFQHTKSIGQNIYIDSASRRWKFNNVLNSLVVTNSIFPVSGNEDNHFSVSINGETFIASACDGPVIQFNVFNPITFKPWKNITTNGVGLSGSVASDCAPNRNFNFDFITNTPAKRERAKKFLDSIPNGYFVVVRNIVSPDALINNYAPEWRADENIYGVGNTMYHRLLNQGFVNIDSFYKPRAFAFVYKKNDAATLAPSSKVGDGTERVQLFVNAATPGARGTIISPAFGPAATWKDVKWRGNQLEATAGDKYAVKVVGIKSSGVEDTLFTLSPTQQDFNISSVSVAQYPYLRLVMPNEDSATLTPYQLRYWRIYYTPVPEGALAPNISFSGKDTLEIGEKLTFAIPFKNVSDIAFSDSIQVRLVLTDKTGTSSVIPITRKKKLAPGDTTMLSTSIDTKSLEGTNTLYLEFNPNLVQPEQFSFNNFLYKNFYVKPDLLNPLMDVTFDGVHILNNDIVSAKPKIMIKLKDEAKFLALDDTSLVSVSVVYPRSSNPRRFYFGTDTLKFIPADLSTGKNEATIEFNPRFLADSDGDFYELRVKAKDKSGNNAGNVEYSVRFQVINKPMISNMFNYPNPFTSSTAFVFTITGSEVPQNIRIQIMTITGKIVKDITKQELGPLNIGRNITEYKWDGTDQYGQKLANGIYLYRVITNLNGNTLEKFSTTDGNGNKVDTDKYFNKGYGKMYLMR